MGYLKPLFLDGVVGWGGRGERELGDDLKVNLTLKQFF